MTDTAPTTDLAALVETQANQLYLLEEQIGALELALEDVGWQRQVMSAQQEFSKAGLDRIAELARMMLLKNPLIRRAVETKTNYVWGQGVGITVKPDAANEVVQAFLDDEKNQAELTSHQARLHKDAELQADGNVFLVLFTNQQTGRVRMRSLPLKEVLEVITNPEDAKEPWYYKRVWAAQDMDMVRGAATVTQRTTYYPDWRYTPIQKPKAIGASPILWNSPVYHIKVGGFSDWRFGVSELYAALDWARAYKEFLEDVATLMRAYSRFAFKLTTKGGKTGIAAAKAKLGTTLGGSNGYDTNPPPTSGSTFIGSEGTDLTPLNVRGATVAPEDGRRFLLMVAAAVGLPETFFGDASKGNHATAKTLDRPTELAMINRQTLWSDVHRDLLAYVLRWAAKAPQGALRGQARVTSQRDGAQISEHLVWTAADLATGQAGALELAVDFPPILAIDTADRVNAIVTAATLNGATLAGTIDDETVSRLLLSALGEQNIDELLAKLHPDDGAALPEAPVAEAVRALRAEIEPLLAKYRSDE